MIVKFIRIEGKLRFYHIYYSSKEIKTLIDKFECINYKFYKYYNYIRGNIMSIRLDNIENEVKEVIDDIIKGIIKGIEKEFNNNNQINIFLNDFKNQQFKNIEKETNSNRDQPYAFLGLGSMGEELALIMYPEYVGSASKGGCAYDLKLENDDYEKIKLVTFNTLLRLGV